MKIWVRIIFLENKWPDLTQRAVENSWINIEVWNKLKWLSNNYFQKWKGPDGLDSTKPTGTSCVRATYTVRGQGRVETPRSVS